MRIALVLLAAAAATHAAEISPRNANYTIEARLDPATRTLRGRQVLAWRNLQARPATELRFHLYWNAWRNDKSTWMLEDRLRGRSDRANDLRDDDWGFMDVEGVRIVAQDGTTLDDRTATVYFTDPDDNNPHDRTVLAVPLRDPVPPGGTIRVAMDWSSRVPKTFARTGYHADAFFLAHWFPQIGVFEPDGWNCPTFHAATEFYADYGVYDVSLTVPRHYVVGATGREVSRRENADGTVTLRFFQEDVHGFAWTASPRYLEYRERFEEPGLPPIEMRLLLQPEHRGQRARHFAAARAAFRAYGTWYGPYPYGHVTIVDPPFGSGFGGMEYPTLFTCGTRVFAPPAGDHPESVTIHEAGHQFWYGLVGNNEFEHAWLDEGLNTFSTIRTLETSYPPRKRVRRYLPVPGGEDGDGFFPVVFGEIEVGRWLDRLDRYRPSAAAELQARPTHRYFPPVAADITYSKTALWLATLERHLGWPTLREILSTFFDRYRFGHPTPEDFFAVAEEIAGRDLDWFFQQVYRDTVTFDYAVDSVSSEPAAVHGYAERDGQRVLVPFEGKRKETASGPYRTEVIVRRLGGGRFPVDVRLVFEDGHEVLASWDGQDTWKRIVVEHETKLDYAEVDPQRVLLLDLDPANNSRRLRPRAALPVLKWSAVWMAWLQDLLATFEFLL